MDHYVHTTKSTVLGSVKASLVANIVYKTITLAALGFFIPSKKNHIY